MCLYLVVIAVVGCLVLCLFVVFVEVAAFVVDFVGLNALWAGCVMGFLVQWVLVDFRLAL